MQSFNSKRVVSLAFLKLTTLPPLAALSLLPLMGGCKMGAVQKAENKSFHNGSQSLLDFNFPVIPSALSGSPTEKLDPSNPKVMFNEISQTLLQCYVDENQKHVNAHGILFSDLMAELKKEGLGAQVDETQRAYIAMYTQALAAALGVTIVATELQDYVSTGKPSTNPECLRLLGNPDIGPLFKSAEYDLKPARSFAGKEFVLIEHPRIEGKAQTYKKHSLESGHDIGVATAKEWESLTKGQKGIKSGSFGLLADPAHITGKPDAWKSAPRSFWKTAKVGFDNHCKGGWRMALCTMAVVGGSYSALFGTANAVHWAKNLPKKGSSDPTLPPVPNGEPNGVPKAAANIGAAGDGVVAAAQALPAITVQSAEELKKIRDIIVRMGKEPATPACDMLMGTATSGKGGTPSNGVPN